MAIRGMLHVRVLRRLKSPSIGLVCLVFAGCGDAKPPGVQGPDVDPATAAASAIEAYDANGDGSLAGDELAKCPPLAQAIDDFDADKNEQLTAEEIKARLSRLFGSGSALMNVSCQVMMGGRPLAGAAVKLRPVSFLADGVQPAEGTTNETGAAKPTIGDEQLPENLRGQSMMQPGLYHVEITHSQQSLSPRYNTETELGFHADPVSRTGSTASFSLKP